MWTEVVLTRDEAADSLSARLASVRYVFTELIIHERFLQRGVSSQLASPDEHVTQRPEPR